MGQRRRLVITGLVQLSTVVLLVAIAIFFVQTYILRLVFLMAAIADSVTSLYILMDFRRRSLEDSEGPGAS